MIKTIISAKVKITHFISRWQLIEGKMYFNVM